MCGIVGIVGVMLVNQLIYDVLMVFQYCGQDVVGIIIIDVNNCFCLCKVNGLVSDVFEVCYMQCLQGNMGIGYVCYFMVGSFSVFEVQLFYVNFLYGIMFVYNGNLINVYELCKKLFEEKCCYINIIFDLEILFNIFVSELDNFCYYLLEVDNIFVVIVVINCLICGVYVCVVMIIGYGMVVFCDLNGICLLVLGKCDIDENCIEYMVVFESVAFDMLGFDFLCDVVLGEVIYIIEEGQLFIC